MHVNRKNTISISTEIIYYIFCKLFSPSLFICGHEITICHSVVSVCKRYFSKICLKLFFLIFLILYGEFKVIVGYFSCLLFFNTKFKIVGYTSVIKLLVQLFLLNVLYFRISIWFCPVVASTADFYHHTNLQRVGFRHCQLFIAIVMRVYCIIF